MYKDLSSALGLEVVTPSMDALITNNDKIRFIPDLNATAEIIVDPDDSEFIHYKPLYPEIEITVEDSTDVTLLNLTATTNEDVRGTIVWTSDLSDEIVKIEGNNLTFIEHYEGLITLTATSANCTTSKTINITCGETVELTTYELGTVSDIDDVIGRETKTTVNYTVIPVYHYKFKENTKGEAISCSKEVTFEANTSTTDFVTRSGTFTDEYDVTVNWSLILKNITPEIVITVEDSTDVTLLSLTATINEDVSGDIVWTSDLSDDIVNIEGNNLTFIEHYEGQITLTATASNCSANKTINITCGETVELTTYELGTVSSIDDVEAEETSASVNYTVIPTYHYKLKDNTKGDSISCSKEVTFDANTSTTDSVTRSGSFIDEYNVTVNWSLILQKVIPATLKIYYTSSDGNKVTPYCPSNITGSVINIISNTYKNGKGCMVFDGDIHGIGYLAFYNRSKLTSITIPDSVTSIGSNAFEGCSELTGSLVIPDSVTSIGEFVFHNCYKLTSVTIGNSVTRIDDSVFRCCSGLTGLLVIPDSVTSIGDSAFAYCSKLTSVTIGNSVTSISSYAFAYCSGLTGSLVIPDSVTSIGSYAFLNCTGLTSVTISNSVKTIKEKAFYGCSGLTGLLVIPNSVTSIGSNAFYQCYKLTSVTIGNSVTSIGDYAFYGCSGLTGLLVIPDSVTSIGEYAFYGCTGLTSVSIGNSVTSIGNLAFRNCTGLTSVTISDSVTSIGLYAFENCTGLTSVYMNSLTPPTILTNTFNNTSTIYYVDLTVIDTYKAASIWSTFADRIEYSYTPQTYKSMAITADDVSGKKTTTNIHYSVVTDGVSNITGETITDVTITGTATSDTFEQNTDTENTVTRHITFTYQGLTAECDITQGVWVNMDQTVDLNSQWVVSTVTKTGYDVYQSNSNYNVNNGYASMKVTFISQPEFKLYINSYAESSYDYTVAFTMDQAAPTTEPAYNTTGVVAHTQSKQLNPTTDLSSGWTCVSYPNDGGEHFVWITYRKDGSTNSNNDRGYVAIPQI